MRKTLLALFGATLLLAACHDDPADYPVPEARGEILFGNPVVHAGWIDGRVETRSPFNSMAQGAAAYSSTTSSAGDLQSDIPDDIGIFAFGDGDNTSYVFKNQRAYYLEGPLFRPDGQTNKFNWDYNQTNDNHLGDKRNLWPYTTVQNETSSAQRPWEPMRYKFFAYSPWKETETNGELNVLVSAENYYDFTRFTWNNIPGFSDKDHVLANEIKEVDNRDKHCKTKDHVVHFEMRHILSRIRFFFRMSKDYRELRRIVLRKVTVHSAGKVKSASFYFVNNKWDAIVHWGNATYGDADPVELVNKSQADYDLPTEYHEEPFSDVYVYPQTSFNSIELEIDYDVYDSAGHRTRKANVKNTINLKPGWDLEAGHYYDVKINVAPNYLYVLSDNDQDFDGYVIIKDSPEP